MIVPMTGLFPTCVACPSRGISVGGIPPFWVNVDLQEYATGSLLTIL